MNGIKLKKLNPLKYAIIRKMQILNILTLNFKRLDFNCRLPTYLTRCLIAKLYCILRPVINHKPI